MIKINKKHPFSQGKNTLSVREKTKIKTKNTLSGIFCFYLFNFFIFMSSDTIYNDNDNDNDNDIQIYKRKCAN